MKKGRELAEVLMQVKEENRMKKDYISSAQCISLMPDGRTIFMQNDQDLMQFEASDRFHSQMGTTLHIPSKYYDLMREEMPQLLADNVNTWLQHREQNYMVRTLDYGSGPVARALLSDKYRRIDNMQVAEAVLPIFAGNPQYHVESCEVTPDRMYIKIVNTRLEMEVVPGDIVQAGVVIKNSEVGLGSISVEPLVYRLVCTNGMIVNDLGMRKKHVGRTVTSFDNSFTIYSDETIEAENKAFVMKLRDTARVASDEALFGQVIGKLRDSKENRITGHIPKVVEMTNSVYGITQSEGDNVLDYLIQGGDLTQYGLANAITRFSQDVESYDRATELEGIGWNVATMPKKQWNTFNSVSNRAMM